MALTLIPFPQPEEELSIAEVLRLMADQIEAGAFGQSHTMAWVIDCGGGEIEIGLAGKAVSPGIVAYYLYGLAQRKLENCDV